MTEPWRGRSRAIPAGATLAAAMLGAAMTAPGLTSSAAARSPAAAAAAAQPAARMLRSGVWLVPGGTPSNREPDGNTVIFEAPGGLIVVDTGRHAEHAQAILAFARSRQIAIGAVVNTHWHLDHVSGNPTLRAAYPGLHVYASGAIDGALVGFLASSAREDAKYANDMRLPEELRADIRADLAAIEAGAGLKPDRVITESRSMTLRGRTFAVHLAPFAATSGDVWLVDERTGVAALGDLVTLPAPFLDTACPEGWQAALAQISATVFDFAVPGHGPPMTPAQVMLYRNAFDSFIACADSPRPQEECATGWANGVGSLLASASLESKTAEAMAADYVAMLRLNGGRSKYCEAPRSTQPPARG